jgi:glutamate dehydrogenase
MADKKNNPEIDEDSYLDEDTQSKSSDVPYKREMTGEDLEEYIEDIAETVRIGLDQSIAILTPWFFKNMPKIYYQTTPRAEKVRHLSAVITGHVFETKQTVELWDRDRSKVTYIGPGGDSKILSGMGGKLLPLSLKMGSVYFSRDNLLFLSTFFTKGHKELDVSNRHITLKIEEARKILSEEFPDDKKGIDNYLENLDNDFVMYATVLRLQVTYRMIHHMVGHEGAHTFLESFENSPKARLTLGIKDVEISEIYEQVLHLIHRYGFKISRNFLINIEKGYESPIIVMHFEIQHKSGEKVEKSNQSTISMVKALRTLGWVDTDEYAQFMQPPFEFSINATSFIRSMASWTHVQLGKENAYYYSEYKILRTLLTYNEITTKLVELFRVRFDPFREKERENDGYTKFRDEVKEDIRELLDPVEREIFRSCIKFISGILKTNYFLPTKTGLAFRLDPSVLNSEYYPTKPFGIYFITGRDYRFFQVRWKDISRGGLRVVMPKNVSDYSHSLSGLFDEVYGLSAAQQAKNKDIPEGGSKAVLLLKPAGNKSRAVRGAINALLDLLVATDESSEKEVSQLINYYDKPEIIYLGPDENMTNDLITWVPEQAQRRGYQYARAFMSSKPGDGINHKEYGVTSEGVNVYADHMLRFLGINPNKEVFTVKMTGGPDGDVAGNELNILYREYGENARVVAIADGFGAAYDPKGLAWKELLRLFKESKSISEFDKTKLSDSKDAYVILADTPENVRKRNELHFKTLADVFIPAGGRPYTVNEKNWNKFIAETGDPTCRAIVEGANIFFTAEAREKLQEAGIMMIKDSSANKTGVICSSFEIIASLLLSPEEFVEIKDIYVGQVIDGLRAKAAEEAKLLFSEYINNGGRQTLVDLSLTISKEINEVTDTLLEEFEKDPKEVLGKSIYTDILYRHVPPILVEKYRDRIESLPEAHKIAILAAFIASRIIYNEGLGWLQTIPEGDRYLACTTYIKQEQETQGLVDSVLGSALSNKDQIAAILKNSAARELTMFELHQSHQKD